VEPFNLPRIYLPMDLISELLNILKEVKGIRIESDNSSIEVIPDSAEGFPVNIIVDGGYYTVGFSGYHDTLTNREEAKNLFFLGLSSNARLTVTSRGLVSYHWILEKREGDSWVRIGHLRDLVLLPFWKQKKVAVYQNSLI